MIYTKTQVDNSVINTSIDDVKDLLKGYATKSEITTINGTNDNLTIALTTEANTNHEHN